MSAGLRSRKGTPGTAPRRTLAPYVYERPVALLPPCADCAWVFTSELRAKNTIGHRCNGERFVPLGGGR